MVEGGLLVLTEDGRQVFLSNFVDSAESGTPPTLSVAGGPAVGTDQLLANLQPISEPAEGPVVGRLPPPEAGQLHGGGAGFSPYDPGDIGPGSCRSGRSRRTSWAAAASSCSAARARSGPARTGVSRSIRHHRRRRHPTTPARS